MRKSFKKISLEWVAIPYIWKEDQTDTVLALAGGNKDVSWIYSDGKPINILYSLPNMNQRRSCHDRDNVQLPIGPKIRNLNIDFVYNQISENQLHKWVKEGILNSFKDMSSLPILVNYEDPSDGTIAQCARAWLNINCAHCLQRGGPAETSGLYLNLEDKDLAKLGQFKPLVSAGRGSGNRKYNIVPGRTEGSILEYRIASTDPRVMMPELNCKLVHHEGVRLI